MGAWRTYLTAGLMVLGAGQAGAVVLADCTRTTHVSHGGEALHRDMGDGRVMWLDWWSQEGTAKRFVLVDCASGEMLNALTAEENMNRRAPFDKSEKALRVIETEHKAARIFATLPRVAQALEGTARDIALSVLDTEPCACAALYADLRGEKAPFQLVDTSLRVRKDTE